MKKYDFYWRFFRQNQETQKKTSKLVSEILALLKTGKGLFLGRFYQFGRNRFNLWFFMDFSMTICLNRSDLKSPVTNNRYFVTDKKYFLAKLLLTFRTSKFFLILTSLESQNIFFDFQKYDFY